MIVKLTPNVTDITEIAKAAEKAFRRRCHFAYQHAFGHGD